MNNHFKNNILIVRDFDTNKFFQEENKKDWELFSFKDFIKTYRKLLSLNLDSVVIGIFCVRDNNFKYFLKLLLVFMKAKIEYFIDNQGNIEYFSFWRFIFIDTPLFIWELIFDLLLVIFSWIVLFVFYLFPKRNSLTSSGDKIYQQTQKLKEIIYLRTDNFRGLQQGGSFTHFRGVVKGFDKLGYKIHYIGSDRIEVPNLDFLQDIIFYSKRFNFPEIPEIYYNWRFIFKAYKAIKISQKTQGIKFIYQRHSIFNVCGVILSYLTKTPLILEYNGSEAWIRQKWGGLLIFKQLCYFMENICLKKADLISVVSEPIKDELLKLGVTKDKILVNYNGVDSERFNPGIDGSKIRKKLGVENKIVIGTLSTFGVWHGTKVFSQAVKLAIQQFQIPNSKLQIHFLFIGDGVERPECERIIQESGMEEYVTFIGTVPFTEIQEYLAACDILVASHIPNPDGTSFFGSPTKLFEYMAMEKGIVASDLDQIGEVLEHKKTAWLVKPGDINNLVDGIFKLAQDRKLREDLGKNARKEVVKNYTWEQNVKRVINAYEKPYKSKIS